MFDDTEKRIEWSIAWLKDQVMYNLEGEVVVGNATELEEQLCGLSVSMALPGFTFTGNTIGKVNVRLTEGDKQNVINKISSNSYVRNTDIRI